MMKKIDSCYKYILIVVFAVTIFLCSWNCDDAFHGFVMVQNLLDGNGFVYNIGERVNAATCPLFYLLIAGVSFFTRELFLTTVVVCTILSTISYAIILMTCCKDKWQSLVLTFVLLFSNSFNSYATSGLENSLLFLEEVLFFYVLIKYEKYNFKQLFTLAFICGCLLITRTDAGLLLFFVTAYCFLFKRECSKSKMFLSGILGLIPFIGWSIFSWFYYGLIFPNTFYIKLNTGIDKADYIEKGLAYFGFTLAYDCFVVIVPIVAMIVLFLQKEMKLKWLGLGFLLKLVYIIYIGGDFMIGRHFTDIFILGTFVLMYALNKIEKEMLYFKICKYSIILGNMAVLFTIMYKPVISDKLHPYGASDCCDERLFYYEHTGTIPYIEALLNNDISYKNTFTVDWDLTQKESYKNANGAILPYAPGIVVLELVDTYYVTDAIGLGDPLFSKLPAIPKEDWRVGHMIRRIPDGYSETVYLGENVIMHPSLHEYYDVFHSIISDDLFDKNRIKKLIDFSMGKYDYLLEDYIEYAETNRIYHYKPYASNFTYEGVLDNGIVKCSQEGDIFWGEFDNNSNLLLLDNQYRIVVDYEIVSESEENYLNAMVFDYDIDPETNLTLINRKPYTYKIDNSANRITTDYIEIVSKDNFKFNITLDKNAEIKIKDIYLEKKEN